MDISSISELMPGRRISFPPSALCPLILLVGDSVRREFWRVWLGAGDSKPKPAGSSGAVAAGS